MAKQAEATRVTYGLSIPSDLDTLIDGAWDKISADKDEGLVIGSGCGSTEYAFTSKVARNKARNLLATELEKFAKELRKGNHDFDNEEESR